MKNNAVVYVIIVFVAIVFTLSNALSFYMLNKKEASLEQAIKANREFILRDERIKNMTKTLCVVYALSKWEAHYYSVIYDDFAKNYKIPWEIYAAVTRIESNFNPTLVSPKQAKGMMQLLEPTAEGIANDIGIDYIKMQTLWNDFLNMVLGCTYLSKNIKLYGLENGVRCYIGGPSWAKNAAHNQTVHQYVKEYRSSVWKEYKQLCLIYRGIVTEENRFTYSDLHDTSYNDSIIQNIELFDSLCFVKQKEKPLIIKGAINARTEIVKARPETSRVIDTSNFK